MKIVHCALLTYCCAVQAPSALVEIPEIEFEIGADAKRKIDSVYNHVAASIYNLSMHVRCSPSAICVCIFDERQSIVSAARMFVPINSILRQEVHLC